MHRRGALLLFCNSCLQSSPHGLEGCAIYRQRESADELEADIHLTIVMFCTVYILEGGM